VLTGDSASMAPREVAAATSLFCTAMLARMPEARAVTAGEQVVEGGSGEDGEVWREGEMPRRRRKRKRMDCIVASYGGTE